MAYPTTPLPIEVGLFVGGAWVDATTTGNGVREGQAVTITAGRSDWAGQVDPARTHFTLDNRDGRWSPDNQTATQWPNFRRNIPTRVGVGLGSTYLEGNGRSNFTVASTPNTAALNFTTAYDIRIELQLDASPVDLNSGGARVALADKIDGSSNGWHWVLFALGSQLHLDWLWFDSGGVQHTTSSLSSGSSFPYWTAYRKLALRTTFEPATGTVTFYHSDTIAGTWIQVGNPVVTGATSIRTATTALTVGGNGADPFGNPAVRGRVTKFELRNGVAGTVVANPDFSVQSVGAASFSDGTGKTWTIGTGGRLTNMRWRFHGELASIPTRWDLSGNDVTAPVEAAGILRRLRQGAAPLASALRRATVSSTGLVQYWPCEETGDNLLGYGAAVGQQPLVIIGGGYPKAASNKDFTCSAPLPLLGTTVPQVLVDPYTGTDWQLRFLLSIPANLTGTDVPIVQWGTSDMSWQMLWRTDGATKIQASRNGVNVYDSGVIGTVLTGAPARIHIAAITNGANVDVEYTTQPPGGVASGFFTANAVAGSPGVVQIIRFNTGQNLGDTAIGHVTLNSTRTDPTTDLAAPLAAFLNESAARRIQRLCQEEGIASRIYGDPDDSLPMGSQRPATLPELLQECADTDGGILYDARESPAVAFRTRASMQGQTPLALNYSSGHLADTLHLDRDDQRFANDVTVTSTGSGRTGRAVLADGSALSVSQPPTGAGRYAQEYRANPNDGGINNLAGWRLRLSAVNEPRVSALALNTNLPVVAASSTLTEQVLVLGLGDALSATGMPGVVLGGGTVRQLVQGYSETIGMFSHRLELNTTSASPWDVLLYDGSSTRYDAAGSTLAAGVSAGATSLSITVATGPLWTTAGGDLPFDVEVGGVRVTVTAISGVASPQTFTVNAVSRALTAGAIVRLADPTYYEL